MTKEFYSNGKLLLSGEYAVLDGAQAWAIPTTYGQSLQVKKKEPSLLVWKSYDENGSIWFEGHYNLGPFSEISSSNAALSKTLQHIIREAQCLNPDFLSGPIGYDVETRLDFPRNWGLGTSSTLVSNMANWARIDPYELLRSTFGGSGYDIACAQHDRPILFHLKGGLPVSLELATDIPFIGALYFVYLNKKKNSRDAIAEYNELSIDKRDFTKRISAISRKMVASQNLKDFEALMGIHEKEIGKALGIEPIQSRLFADYWGAIKSLGAWGGDFILATGNSKTPDYFKEKGYETIIPFSKMVLS